MKANLALNLRNLGVGDFQPVPRSKIPCKFQLEQDSPSSEPSKTHWGSGAKHCLESHAADQRSLLTLTCLVTSKSPAGASHSLHAKAVSHLSPCSIHLPSPLDGGMLDPPEAAAGAVHSPTLHRRSWYHTK